MTRDDVIAMARYADEYDRSMMPSMIDFCERFAALVAERACERERRACANLAYAWGSAEIEKAIRARSNEGVML